MQHLQRQLGSVEYNGKNIAPLEDKGLQHTGFHHLHVRQDLGFKLNTEISTEEEKKTKTFGHDIKPGVHQGTKIANI